MTDCKARLGTAIEGSELVTRRWPVARVPDWRAFY